MVRSQASTPISHDDLLWLAGWLEGEGSFLCGNGSPVIQGQCTDQDVAARVALLFQTKLLGPFLRGPKHYKPYFTARVKGRPAAGLMKLLLPLMGVRRTEQIQKALAQYNPKHSKLTVANVEQIKQLRQQGWTHKSIAAEIGVERSYVTQILNGYVPGRSRERFDPQPSPH